MFCSHSNRFSYFAFDVGSHYDFAQIISFSQVELKVEHTAHPSIMMFQNCNVILVTLDNNQKIRNSRRRKRLNYFNHSAFFWQPPELTDSYTKLMDSVRSDSVDTVLFCRIQEDNDAQQAPYIFCGGIKYEDHEETLHCGVRFRCFDFRPSLQPEFKEIFDLRPPGHKATLAIEKYDLDSVMAEHINSANFYKNASATRNNRLQGLMDQYLFGYRKQSSCAFCGKSLPVSMLQAAYIKPKRLCSEEELVDRENFLCLCKIGCQQFFERNYLIVDEKGTVKKNRRVAAPQDLRICLNRLSGESCRTFSGKNKTYFEKRRSAQL